MCIAPLITRKEVKPSPSNNSMAKRGANGGGATRPGGAQRSKPVVSNLL